MYKNLLVPVSFDADRDSAGAIEIAKTLMADGGRITLIHVMEEIPSYAISYMPKDYLNTSREAVKAELDAMAAEVPGSLGVLVEGHSGRTILDWAGDNNVDCIVIASHRPGMQDLFLGSTAAQVVRHAPCAVHVVR